MRSWSGELEGTRQHGLLAEAGRAVDALVSVGTTGLAPMQVRAHLRWVSDLIDRLELVRTLDVRALDLAHAADLTGATGMVDFVSQECGLMPEGARDRVVLGRQLEALPLTAGALRAGEVSFDTAALVAQCAASVKPERVARVESEILTASKCLAPGQLRRAAEVIKAQVDRGAFESAAERAQRHRALRVGPDRDGLATISGKLTSVAAAKLRSALEVYMKPLNRGDKRSAQQRRHDALEQVCTRGGRAHVQVVAPVEALTGSGPGSGSASGSGSRSASESGSTSASEPGSASASGAGAAALLEGLIPISRAELLRLLEDGASVSAVLRNKKGNVVYAGRARNLTPAQRRLLLLIAPTCVFRGCTRPAVESQAHHVREYCLGGMTDPNTQPPLCGPHQVRVHRDGWWVLPKEGGGFQTLPPGDPQNPVDRLSPAEYGRAVLAARQARRAERSRKARTAAKAPATKTPATGTPALQMEARGPAPP